MASGKGAAGGWAARMLDALAARPAGTTLSRPIRRRSVWAAALAARPITTARLGPADEVSSPHEVGDESHQLPVVLRGQVRRALADALAVDTKRMTIRADADIEIADGPPIRVRVADGPPRVEVRYPVLADVAESEALHAQLSRLNAARPDARYTYAEGTIWASQQVPGVDFQPVHLRLAIDQVSRAAPAAADELRPEFGGTLPQSSSTDKTATATLTRPDSDAGLRPPLPAPLYRSMGIEVTREWFVIAGHHYPVTELSNLRIARGPHHPYTMRAAVLLGVSGLAAASALGLAGGAALYPYAFLAFAAALMAPPIAMLVGGLLRPRSWELWADYYTLTIRLFVTDNEHQYGQVTRALLRAQEIARLGAAAELRDLEPWLSWRRMAVRR